MALGDPNQGEQQWALINELIRKQEEQEAQAKVSNLSDFMSVADENVARNSEELQRRAAERQRLRSAGRLSSIEEEADEAAEAVKIEQQSFMRF